MDTVYMVVAFRGTFQESTLGAFSTRELADAYAKVESTYYPADEPPYVYEMPVIDVAFYS